MILFFVLSILILSTIVVISLFAPEKLPWYRPHLMLNPQASDFVKVKPLVSAIRQPIIIEGLADPEPEKTMDLSAQEKIARLENMLIEKNATIEKLQKQVIGEKASRVEFEKVKALLDEEIASLRKQNRELKIKTGEA